MFKGSILSGPEIAAAYANEISWRENGQAQFEPRIWIVPFNPIPSHDGGQLNPNSYNLRLHNELIIYRGTGLPLDCYRENPTELINFTASGYMLSPGTLYLARTVEYTQTHNLVATVDGRSSLGRLGLQIHSTAGYIDNGFKGHITLEMSVIHPLVIYPDMAIAQIRYHTTGPGWKYQGKYNNQPGSPAGSSEIWREKPR